MTVINLTFSGADGDLVSGMSGVTKTSGTEFVRQNGSGGVKHLTWTAGSPADVTVNVGASDMYAECTLGADFNGKSGIGPNLLNVRANGTNPTTGVILRWSTSSGLLLYEGATLSKTMGGTAASGDVIRLSVEGLLVSVRKNGTLVDTFTLAADTGLTRAGFGGTTDGSTPVLTSFITSFQAGDIVAKPVLSSPSASATSTTTISAGVTIDKAATGYVVATTSATKPTPAEVADGEDHTGTPVAGTLADNAALSVGANPGAFDLSGATPGEDYYLHFTAGTSPDLADVVTYGPLEMPVPVDPPELSDGTKLTLTDHQIELGATTDSSGGWYRAILTATDDEPTAEQVRDGQDYAGDPAEAAAGHEISATGAHSLVIAAPDPETTYYAYLVHLLPGGELSDVLALGEVTTYPAGASVEWLRDNPISFMAQCVEVGDPDTDWMSYEIATPPATGEFTDGPYPNGTCVYIGPSPSSMVIALKRNGVAVGTFVVYLYDQVIPTNPVLTNAMGAATGENTASGSVDTDVPGGTLFWATTTNATESKSTIQASGNSQPVTVAGTQSFSTGGLTAGTGYRHHIFHIGPDAAESGVVSTSLFTTDAAAPAVLTSPTGAALGAFGAVGSVSTDKTGGLLYWLVSENSSEDVEDVILGGSQPVSSAGTQVVTSFGLTPETGYYIHFVHDLGGASYSNVASSSLFTTPEDTGPSVGSQSGGATMRSCMYPSMEKR